jgi:hypothetical protein
MVDEEGNISMSLDQLHPSANCDQVTACHEDPDMSQAQQLTDCDPSENRDVDATLNPNSVMLPLEGDINSPSRDLQDTARTRLNDSTAIDTDISNRGKATSGTLCTRTHQLGAPFRMDEGQGDLLYHQI